MKSRRTEKETRFTTIPTLLDDGTLHEMIERRAYELYEMRGCVEGYDCEDWLGAERQVLAELKQGPAPLTRPMTEHAA